MTCIAAVEHDGKVYMAADSLTSSGYRGIPGAKKIHRVGPLLIGSTGAVRFGQIIEYELSIEDDPRVENAEKFLVTQLVPSIRKAYEDSGEVFDERRSSKGMSGMALVAFRGRVYEVFSDGSVVASHGGIAATGCGLEYALGAMHAASDYMPEDRVRAAIAAAVHFDVHCGGDIQIEVLA